MDVAAMKVGVVSDVHNNVRALRHALHRLAECDLVLCLGDLVSDYRVDPAIIQLARDGGLVGLAGNHEKTILLHPGSTLRERLPAGDLEYLSSLPASRALEVGGRRITAVHGAPWDEPDDYRCEYVFERSKRLLDRLKATPCDILLLGHTHVPMLRRLGSVLVLNPGSCGEARDGTERITFAELDFTARRASVYAIEGDAETEPILTGAI